MKTLFRVVLLTLVKLLRSSFAQSPPPHALLGQLPNGFFSYISMDSSGNLNTTGGSAVVNYYQGGAPPAVLAYGVGSNGVFVPLQVDSSGNLKVSGAASGTVTHTGGPLTSGSLVAGNGSNDLEVLASDPTN